MRQTYLRLLAIVLCFGLTAHTLSAQAEVFEQGAVASDNALASQVGAEVLARGGNAVDAAVATALTLGVVNPFASGLGGGGFAMIYHKESQTLTALDFRETAPQNVRTEDYAPNGTHDPMLSRTQGLAVGVPGELAGLVAMHQRFGRLPWHSLVAPAQRIAQRGFPAHELMVGRVEILRQRAEDFDGIMAALYQIDGPLQEGVRVRRPKLARALELLERSPIERFYRGTIAKDIAQSVQKAHGKITVEDLQNYQVVWREPHPMRFRGYDFALFPLPSSSAIIFDITLRGYAALQRAAGAPEEQSPFHSAETLHRFLHAMTWGFAIRAEDLGDPDFSDIDVERLYHEDTIQKIVRTFDPKTRQPAKDFSHAVPPPNDSGTTHFSVMDADGNAVAFTSTVNTIYGSQVVSERYGILLNNEMDDFATAPMQPNAFGLVGLEANAVRPGARPLSSMSPTLVFKDDKVIASLGGSGGPRIITATIQTLLGLMDGLDTENAIQKERIHHQWLPEPIELEGSLETTFGDALRKKNYEIAPNRWRADVQAIWRRENGWDAGSDTSKGGQPAGVRFRNRQNVDRVEHSVPQP